MNIAYISEKDWAEFEKRYPSANDFLVRASLVGEEKALKQELKQGIFFHPGRKSWIEQRLKDLNWGK